MPFGGIKNAPTLERVATAAEQLRTLPLTFRSRRDNDWEERFWKFHRSHPEIYRILVHFTRQMKRYGRRQYGINAVFERARWHAEIERGDREFKINNNYAPFYARLIMEQEPDLKGIFNVRKRRKYND